MKIGEKKPDLTRLQIQVEKGNNNSSYLSNSNLTCGVVLSLVPSYHFIVCEEHVFGDPPVLPPVVEGGGRQGAHKDDAKANG